VYRIYFVSTGNDVDIVACTLKARIMKPQQPAVTTQQPVNNSEIAISEQSVPMTVHATMEYAMPSLSNNCTATENGVFYAVRADML
jgi:hypothetical protein